MAQRIDLSNLKWTLCGWEANSWRLYKTEELAGRKLPDVEHVPAKLPGSVQSALLKAGIIPDWNVGLNSRQCEWVEHMHWDYTALLPKGLGHDGKPVRLVCQGLDYSGSILIDGKVIAEFVGTLLPHVFDLTPHINPAAKQQTLSIVFEGAPREQNQHGFTSRSHFFKPRFAYKWDWCARVVPLGAWDKAWIETGAKPRLDNVRPRPILEKNLETGRLSVECKIWSAGKTPIRLKAKLMRKGRKVAEAALEGITRAGEQLHKLAFEPFAVKPWQANGFGEQTLYDLEIELWDTDAQSDSWRGQVGFKRVEWLPCAGAPRDALPWICSVNGQPIFLQGVNWTPVRPNYQDVTRADYAKRIKAYAAMGCNILRVWGGGLIERQDFYDLCNEFGLLVWQEFPLSSSGIENTPPADPDAIQTILKIAVAAIERRAGNVSLLLWCGGNELTFDPEHIGQPGGITPCDERHPCLKALGDLTRKLDPDHRFLPTTPTGPYFGASPERFGQGVHHNVHGPWNVDGTLEAWKEFFDRDDSLMRTEMGCPSASPLDIIERFKGDLDAWPPKPENPYWRHVGHWWTNWHKFKDELLADETEPVEFKLARYIHLSQKLQADALAYVAHARKSQFPRFAGMIIWMGHDCFPCLANTSLLDFYGRPKPAAKALAKVFLRPLE